MELTRDGFLIDIADFDEQIAAFRAQRDEAVRSIGPMVDDILASGDDYTAPFAEIRDTVEYCDAVIGELAKRKRQEQLDLWRFDLDALKAEVLKAIQDATDTRREIIQVQTDKTNYLRAAGANGATRAEKDDKMANFDILLVDARSRAHAAEVYRDKLKADLQAMQSGYNAVAREEGWTLEPEKAEPARMYGLT
jgi:hypothetical protein